jgi:hypothetical protein
MTRTPEQLMADYREFRGKCRELCEAAVKADPSLTIVRGHYFDWQWGEQPHWWTVRKDGSIYDPTARQFPSNGSGAYVPFSGVVECAECGKQMQESEAEFGSNYAFCSYVCHGRFVGAF